MAYRVVRLSLIVSILFAWLASFAGCALPSESEPEACEVDLAEAGKIASTSDELSSLSCKMSADTGYKSGKSFKIQVVSVDGEKVEWKTANAYMRMAKAAAADGVQIRIVSGFRTMSEQKYLYGCYVNCSCNGCNLAAKPGYSNHQSGHALDLNTSSAGVLGWLTKHGGKFGFKRTVPGEPWHWEWWGQDDGAGPCNGDTLKAGLVGKWSTAEKYRGKGAHFLACTGDKLKLGLTFRNKGSAIWRDVEGRGDSIGSDVFLVTANGKADKLTGKKRYSLSLNANAKVRGDHAAPECSDHAGCRKTKFIDGGMLVTAPKKPGVYSSRWRLRDYSKVWGKSAAFGPKVEVKLKVVNCQQPAQECGCRVWCSDGSSQKLTADAISDGASCKTVGATFCKPGTLVNHAWSTCADASPGETPSEAPAEPGDGADSLGEDPTDGWTSDPLDPSESEPDDPDFDDEGFDGNEVGDGPNLPPASDAGGCSLATPGKTGAGAGALVLAGLVVLAMLRRRRKLAAALIVVPLAGCSASDGTEHLGTAELAVSAPKKAFCKVSVSGHGSMDLE
jgi:MYXO-CTERM domain-containing protein